MKTSRSGVDLIKSLEGLRLTSYLDSVGVPTIGYGHTGPDIALGQKIDHQHAEVVLRKDLIRFENAVKESVKIELNQHQFDALVSFAFNVGVNAFKDSTLLRRLNNKEDPSTVAKQELPRWNKGLNNKVLEGLTRRRIREVELFALPCPKQRQVR
jgi:lysozyme